MLACRVRVSRHWGLAALFEGELARTSLDASHGGAAGSPRAPAALSRIASSSRLLLNGLFRPTPNEAMVLGLSPHHQVARIHRLRSGDAVPMALEYSSLPEDILPRPDKVDVSLYELLRARNSAPSRAIQRVTAINATAPVAELLELPEGAAILQIERTGYLQSGRPIEFTSGLYRSDVYDFVSELRLD